MISLTCTHCQTVLSIDDAFAGGVCRCQHCGTIQTVPSHLKHGAVVNAGVGDSQSSASGQKALYQSKRMAGGRADETGSGTGLEDLADVVASSGLGGSGLSASTKARKLPPRRPAESVAVQPPARSKVPLLAAVGVVVAILAGVAIWKLVGSNSKPDQSREQPDNAGGATGVAPAVAAGPQFCGIPVSGTSIIYLLDRGNSATSMFDAMKEATYKSIESLGPDRKFQVLLWDNGTGDAGFPAGSATFATAENIDACRKALDDVVAQRQSDIVAPLTHAVAELPDSIVIVTAKGSELDDAFVGSVQGIIKGTPIKLFNVSLVAESPALETLAKRSGGEYRTLSDGALRAAAGG